MSLLVCIAVDLIFNFKSHTIIFHTRASFCASIVSSRGAQFLYIDISTNVRVGSLSKIIPYNISISIYLISFLAFDERNRNKKKRSEHVRPDYIEDVKQK